MPRIWKEAFEHDKHRSNPMLPYRHVRSDDNLVPDLVYRVNVCSFDFQFGSVAQLRECLAFFARKTHPNSIIPRDQLGWYGGDQGETQRWYERLPLWLFEEPKRVKVVKALERAVHVFEPAAAQGTAHPQRFASAKADPTPTRRTPRRSRS